jgi:hypothetical protein
MQASDGLRPDQAIETWDHNDEGCKLTRGLGRHGPNQKAQAFYQRRKARCLDSTRTLYFTVWKSGLRLRQCSLGFDLTGSYKLYFTYEPTLEIPSPQPPAPSAQPPSTYPTHPSSPPALSPRRQEHTPKSDKDPNPSEPHREIPSPRPAGSLLKSPVRPVSLSPGVSLP